MTNMKWPAIGISLWLIAACAPLPDQNRLGDAISPPDAPAVPQTSETATADTTKEAVQAPDNATDAQIKSTKDDGDDRDDGITIASEDEVRGADADNQSVSDNAALELSAADEGEEEAKAVIETPAVKIEPKPVLPVNPANFVGLALRQLTDRLGAADSHFSEQQLDVYHYSEPSCTAMFFVHNAGQGEKILYIDLRPTTLKQSLNRQACYLDFGVRAENVLAGGQG